MELLVGGVLRQQPECALAGARRLPNLKHHLLDVAALCTPYVSVLNAIWDACDEATLLRIVHGMCRLPRSYMAHWMGHIAAGYLLDRYPPQRTLKMEGQDTLLSTAALAMWLWATGARDELNGALGPKFAPIGDSNYNWAIIMVWVLHHKLPKSDFSVKFRVPTTVEWPQERDDPEWLDQALTLPGIKEPSSLKNMKNLAEYTISRHTIERLRQRAIVAGGFVQEQVCLPDWTASRMYRIDARQRYYLSYLQGQWYFGRGGLLPGALSYLNDVRNLKKICGIGFWEALVEPSTGSWSEEMPFTPHLGPNSFEILPFWNIRHLGTHAFAFFRACVFRYCAGLCTTWHDLLVFEDDVRSIGEEPQGMLPSTIFSAFALADYNQALAKCHPALVGMLQEWIELTPGTVFAQKALTLIADPKWL